MYLTLTKTLFKNSFSLTRLFHMGKASTPSKKILVGFLVVLLLASYVSSFGYMFFDLSKTLSDVNLLYVVLFFAFFYLTMMTVIFSLFRSSGSLFRYKDYQILAPLPIKDSTVLFAKATIFLIYLYISCAILIVPMMFGYFFFQGFNVLSFIIFLLFFLSAPLLTIIPFSFISFAISLLTSKMKHSNIFQILFLLAFTLGIMFLSFSMNSNEANPFLSQQDLMESLGNLYFVSRWFVQGIYKLNFLSIIGFIGINVIPFYIYIHFVQTLTKKTNQSSQSVITYSNLKEVQYESNSIMKALIKKEARKYVSVPMYLLNTIFSPIMMIIFGLILLFSNNSMDEILVQFEAMQIPVEAIIALLLGFSISLIYTPGISLSLEGKQFWIPKSLPITAQTIVKSKIFFNLLLQIPSSVIVLTVFSFCFKIGVGSYLSLLLFLIAFSLVTSYFASLMNLLFPRLDFTSDIQIVKQSMSAVLSMFGGWLFLIIPGFIAYYGYGKISIYAILALGSFVNFICYFVLRYFVLTKANQMIAKIAG